MLSQCVVDLRGIEYDNGLVIRWEPFGSHTGGGWHLFLLIRTAPATNYL
jgi:hypothetical protein